MIWTPTYTRVAIGLVATGLSAIVLTEYTSHIKADAQAQATIQAQAAIQKTLQQQIAELEKAMSDRDAQYQADKKAQDMKFQQAASPTQIAALVAQLMGLKQPIQIVTPPPTAANPNPAPIAEVSTLDAPQVKAYLSECEACKLQLPKAQADLKDREAQMALAQKQIESLQTQRDAAVKEAKGGSWVKRVGKAVEYLVIGAAAGYAAAKH